MEDVLKTAISYMAPIAEACGALAVFLGVIRAILQYLYAFIRPHSVPVGPIRIRLGQSMVIGLEFQVAADILKTALSPDWNDVLFLAALIALRTILNYLLERELRVLNRQQNGGEQQA